MTQRMQLFSLFIAVAMFTAPAYADDESAAIDVLVKRAMDAFDAPGVTVAVVKDGEVRHSAGYGVLKAGERGTVDADTLFQIGSVSKAFTAAALALLADEGKLGFDDRVIDHLPEFRLHDAWVTREFTVRDLLTHRSGLPLGAGDLLMFPEGETSRQEIMEALRHFAPASSFRSKYDYDNSLYIVAGIVVERVSGESFEDFLEQRLLQPLGMDNCTASFGRATSRADKAVPHLEVDGDIVTTYTGLKGDTGSPAGGITCDAPGMARWMQFILDGGVTPEGERLLSEAQFAQLLAPVTLTATPGYLSTNNGAELSAYALGWSISTFHGQPIHSHGGGLLGMTTHLALWPRAGLGVYVSNNLMSPLPRPLAYDIAELYLDSEDPDWIGVIDELWQARLQAGADAVAQSMERRDADSTPSLALADYAGTYRDAWYGDITLALEDDGRLWFRSGRSARLVGPLEHYQYDTFIVRWEDRRLNADAYVSFTLAPEGSIEGIRMKAVSPTTDFSFDFHDLDLRKVVAPAPVDDAGGR